MARAADTTPYLLLAAPDNRYLVVPEDVSPDKPKWMHDRSKAHNVPIRTGAVPHSVAHYYLLNIDMGRGGGGGGGRAYDTREIGLLIWFNCF